MKKKYFGMFILLVLFLVLFLNYDITNSKQKDGWHVVATFKDNKKDKDWIYFENGTELIRLDDQVFVHRGWRTAPENSLEALKLVKKNGYYAAEIDIRFTKDNIPILLHDETINFSARNNDLSKIEKEIYAKDLTLKEIKKYSFSVTSRGETLKKYKNNRITTFEEALKYAKDNKLTFEIELKEGTRKQIKKLVELVQKYDMDRTVFWISYLPNLLEYVKEADDDEMLSLIPSAEMKENLNDVYKRLKTKKNIVVIPNYEEDNIYNFCPNLPDEIDNHPISKYIIE